MSDDVEIKGRIIQDRPGDLYILFRPKAPVPVSAVFLPRDQIAVVQDLEFCRVTMPFKLALQKGLEEYA